LRGRVSQVGLSRANNTTNTGTLDADRRNTRYQVTSSHFEQIFANLVHRTNTDFVPRQIPQAERVPSLAKSDVFWDTSDPFPLEFQAESSLLSFADMASNSDSGYWTDSDCVGSIMMNSCSSYPQFPESPFESNHFGVGSSDNTNTPSEEQKLPPVFKTTNSSLSHQCITEVQSPRLPPQGSPTLLNECPHQAYTPSPTESPGPILLEPSARWSEEALLCNEDPFMGSWASQKANHLFHDYDWVLSHVENL